MLYALLPAVECVLPAFEAMHCLAALLRLLVIAIPLSPDKQP